MAAVTTVPLTITPEAEAHVAQLGFQAEMERMLEYTRQTVPDLQRIDIWLQPPYDTGDDPGVILEITRGGPDEPDDSNWEQWRDWVIATFSPEVWRQFMRITV